MHRLPVKPFPDRRQVAVLWLIPTVLALCAGTVLQDDILRLPCLLAAAVALRMALASLRPSRRSGREGPVPPPMARYRVRGAVTADTAGGVAAVLGKQTERLWIGLRDTTVLTIDGARVVGTAVRAARHRGVMTLISRASSEARDALRRAGVDELVTYVDDRTA
ncbi:hypothetical protein [Streptomyces rubiginosohelvolus]|uniref:hypothetical protein n=1 Tax=Streptomyces rubiginosohelvolus TaxID=67362 RepID=UPI0035DD89A8